MSPIDPLEELDHIGYPDQDPYEDAKAIAVELRAMAADRRKAILAALPRWLADPSLARQGIAMDLAVEFQDPDLMRAAVAEAARLGIHDEPHEKRRRQAWLTYHLMLLPCIARFPTPEGMRYIEHCASQMASAESATRRELSARACLFVALSRPADMRAMADSCLRAVRAWRDKWITASALVLLSTQLDRYPELAELLEPTELQYARSYLPRR